MRKLLNLIYPEFIGGRAALGLLLLRAVAGVAMMMHGWSKIQAPFSWMNQPGAPSPIPGVLQALAALGEFGGGLGILVGCLTPLAALGIVCTMIGAKQIALADAPWIAAGGGKSWELASLYLLIGAVLIFTGPGRFSLDALLFDKRDVSDERMNVV